MFLIYLIYIHLKFGECLKCYYFTSDFKCKNNKFCEEYEKYFEGKRSQFKNAFQVVNYIKNNKIPIKFYFNFTDTPAKNYKEIMDYI